MANATQSPAGRRHAERGLGRAFAGLWAASAAANLADGLTLVLLPLVAVSVTDAPGAVAAVMVATTVAWPAFGLPAGWIVDAIDRRRVLVAVNLVRAIVLTLVAWFAVADRLSVSVLCAAAVVLGIGETLADTSLTALVPMVVTSRRRGVANARIETTVNLLNQLVGPPLAGLLAGVSLLAGAGTAAALYGLALVGMVALPRRRYVARREDAPQSAWQLELTAGLRLLWRDRMLRALTLVTAAMNLVWAVWTALFVVYAVEPGPLGLSPAGYGLLLTAMAVGGVIAAPLVDPLTRSIGVRAILVLDLVGTLVLVLPVGLGLGPAPVVAGTVLAGAGATVWRTVVATVRQNLVDEVLMGRVYAASRFVSWGVLPVGGAIGGVLAETLGVRTTFGIAAAFAAALVVMFPLSMRGHDLDGSYAGSIENRPDQTHE
ncbi:MAG: MFS transporter [Nocardioidaceae bacterium]